MNKKYYVNSLCMKQVKKDEKNKQYRIYFFSFSLLLKELNFIFLFAITAVGVVPCDSSKKPPPTSSIVRFIFHFWSFEISRNTLDLRPHSGS